MPPSAYLVRDLLQYIVPTLVGLTLFVPLVEDDIGAGFLVVAALAAGYGLGPVVSAIAGPLVRLIPGIGRAIRDHQRTHLWWSANVDFDRLWYRLSRDDRQALQAAGAYGELYAVVAFYLGLFAVMAAVHAVLGVEPPADLAGRAWDDAADTIAGALLAPTLAVFGGWQVPAAGLALIGLIAFFFAARGYVRESGMLFGEDGHHASMARTYQLRSGDIATGIWGRLTRGGIPVREASITVFDIEERRLDEVETDRQGRFQLPGLFRQCFPDGQDIAVRTFRFDINIDGDHRLCDVPINRRQVPELTIDLT